MKHFQHWLLACLLLALLLPHATFAQDEPSSKEERKMRRKFIRSCEDHLHFNTVWWPDHYEGELPERYRTLQDYQRNMLRGEYIMPGEPTSKAMLEAMQLQPGDTLVDFGCGMAHEETLLMTLGMDSVTVYGLDIDTFALEVAPRMMEWTRRFIHFYNASMGVVDPSLGGLLGSADAVEFIPVLCTQEDPNFPVNGTGKLMCVRTLHHLDEAEIATMVSLVRSQGFIYIIDHLAKKPGKSKCHDGEVKYYLTQDEIIQRMEEAGCVFVNMESVNPRAGMFVFQRL